MNRKSTLSGCATALLLGGVLLSSGGCENDRNTGLLIGSAAGAGLGAIIGKNTGGHTATGALIGAGVGAGAGYIVGNETDKARANNKRNEW